MSARSKKKDDINYGALDPGIRRTVRWLRSRGWETCDSGDGVTKFAQGRGFDGVLDFPHVCIQIAEPRHLVNCTWSIRLLLHDHGIKLAPVGTDGAVWIEATYDPESDRALILISHLHDGILPPELGTP